MYVTRLEDKHIEAVLELERLCFAHPISENNLKMLLTEGSGTGFVLLDEEERTVAYGGIICVLDEGQILNIATHPEHRRRGYGKKIMEEIVTHAKEKQIAFITLEVRESNDAALSLYHGMGFYEVGKIKGYYDTPKEDAIILRLDLV